MSKSIAMCSTRKLYPYIPPLVQSIYCTNSYVDNVYIIAEDDDIHGLEKFKDRVKILNVNKLPISINTLGVNYTTSYTYMSFLRLYFSQIFTQEEKILYVDIDTCFNKDVSHLWDIDMSNYSVMMCSEPVVPQSCKTNRAYSGVSVNKYYNSGVVFFNLKYIRDNGFFGKFLSILENNKLPYPDQDVLNIVCNGTIYDLPATYNTKGFSCKFGEGQFTNDQVYIYHYVNKKPWRGGLDEHQVWKEYKEML